MGVAPMKTENADIRVENDPKQGEYFIIEVDKLVPYANNARTHSKAQIDRIAASIRAFGYMTPITIDENNTILSGHGRYYALQKPGIKKIPCIHKYAFPCFLLRLGFIGDGYKRYRKILPEKPEGSGAFRSGAPKAGRRPSPQTSPTSGAETEVSA